MKLQNSIPHVTRSRMSRNSGPVVRHMCFRRDHTWKADSECRTCIFTAVDSRRDGKTLKFASASLLLRMLARFISFQAVRTRVHLQSIDSRKAFGP